MRPGDTVEIVHLGTKGTVLSPADRNGEVQIQAGIIKMKAHISQLRLVEPDKPKQSRVINRVSRRQTRCAHGGGCAGYDPG